MRVLAFVEMALGIALPLLMAGAIVLALLAGNLPLMWYLLALFGVCVVADIAREHLDFRRHGCTDADCEHLA